LILTASAGAGKTYNLVQYYLSEILSGKRPFYSILAVTFTNAAANEMKERVLETLFELSFSEKEDSYINQLQEFDGLRTISEDEIRQRAKRTLHAILHDYSRFSVSTLDSFFQTLIRSFAKEYNLQLGYTIELDKKSFIREAVDRYLNSIKGDSQASDSLNRYMEYIINEGKSWNLEDNLARLSEELFTPECQGVLEHYDSAEELIKQINDSSAELSKVVAIFENELDKIAEEVLSKIEELGIDESMLANKSRAQLKAFFQRISKDNKDYKLNKTVLAHAFEEKSFFDKKEKGFEEEDKWFQEQAAKAANIIQDRIKEYRTAVEVRKNIFLLGLLWMVNDELRSLRDEKGVMLIEDTNALIESLVRNAEMPFIYEKVGSRYSYFMIDEFQDTSDQQWRNIEPLLTNAVSEGSGVLIVGDIKQSISRWRGGNLDLLRREAAMKLNEHAGSNQVEYKPLTGNWRSASQIVEFNNAFFPELPSQIETKLGVDFGERQEFKDLLGDLEQSHENDNHKGLVQIEGMKRDPGAENIHLRTKELIEEILEDGYQRRDITVLTRKKDEGSALAAYLSAEGIEVISSEALLFKNAPQIDLLVSALLYLGNPDNKLIETNLYSAWQKLNDRDISYDDLQEINDFSEKLKNTIKASTRGVYEVFLDLLIYFKINPEEDSFIKQFSDHLYDFALDESATLSDFGTWWEENNEKLSYSGSTNKDAVSIMTIHKSKGLGFKVVIIPFMKARKDDLARNKGFLWVSTEGKPEPYNKLPYLPIEHHVDTESYFEEELNEETLALSIDTFNTWYVAFTRAKERLYVIYEKQKELCLFTELLNSFKLKNEFDAGESVFSLGERSVKSKATQKTSDSRQSKGVKINTYWRDKLTIKKKGFSIADEKSKNLNPEIRKGILVHKALELIQTPTDIDSAIKKLQLEGFLKSEERSDLNEQLSGIIEHSDLASYFSGDYRVMNEKEILIPGNSSYRPDRVMISKDRHATVIDYKTGQWRKEHENQLKQYSDLLSEMGYKVDEALLFYTGDLKTVKIS